MEAGGVDEDYDDGRRCACLPAFLPACRKPCLERPKGLVVGYWLRLALGLGLKSGWSTDVQE